MRLIRCDQCGAELQEPTLRYWEVRLHSLVRQLGDPEDVQLCSESCAAAWFKERAPEVVES